MDVTLNTNKTESIIQFPHNANYAMLIYTIKISPPAPDEFIPKSPVIYYYFYNEQTELNDTLLSETQEQDPTLKQEQLWKNIKTTPLHSFTDDTSKQRIITLLSTFPGPK